MMELPAEVHTLEGIDSKLYGSADNASARELSLSDTLDLLLAFFPDMTKCKM
jgi:hypothetical protein